VAQSRLDIDASEQDMSTRQRRQSSDELLGDLIDRLADPRSASAGEAIRVLWGLVPMAALPERWPDNTSFERDQQMRRPDWLKQLCGNRATENSFISLCVAKLRQLDDARAGLFLQRMAVFPGAQREFTRRLRQDGLSAYARRFVRELLVLRGLQLPAQVSFSPTMACQLKCDYCISAGVAAMPDNEVPLSKAFDFLAWARRVGVLRLGLTGGEPTLYSQLVRLLKSVRELKLQFYLATNGLGSAATTAAIIEAKPLCVTLHLTREVLQSKLLGVYVGNARELVKNGVYVAMRCNFLRSEDDPASYLEVAGAAGIKEARAAIGMPNAQRANAYVNCARLAAYGEVLGRFASEGKRRNIEPRLSKPFPLCKLPVEAARTFLGNGSLSYNCPVHTQKYANNLVVYPDMSFSACLGLSMNSRREILEFDSLREAGRLYSRTVRALMHQPLLEECTSCPLWKGGRCVGACLSYRLDRQVPPAES